MKTNSAKSKRIGIVLVGAIIMVILLVLLLLVFGPNLARQLAPAKLISTNSAPLIVTLMYPSNGQVIQPDREASVLMDAVGAFPLTRLQLTIRGPESLDVVESLPGNINHARKNLMVMMPSTPGEYALVATVFDERGFSAISSVAYVQVTNGAEESYEEVLVSSWEDLLQVAEEHQIGPESLVALNPQLIPEDGIVGEAEMEPTLIKVRLAPLGEIPPDSFVPVGESPPPPDDSGNLGDVITGIRTIVSSITDPNLVPPAPAQIMKAKVSGCMAELVFTQGDDSEKPAPVGYFIYRATKGNEQNFRLLETLQAQDGPITFRNANLGGNTYLYMVRPFNGAGETMGEIVSLEVDTATCGGPKMARVSWELASFKVPGNITDFYCYVSMLGSPWIRVPQNPGEFMTPDEEGIIEIPKEMPIPVFYEQNSYPFAANCWGWSGDTLMDLGTAEGTLTETSNDTWETEVSNANFSFNGIFRSRIPGGAGGAARPERWFVPAPIGVKVVDNVLECQGELFQKGGIQGSSTFCQPAIGSANVLLSWDWSNNIQLWPKPGEALIPTIDAPDKYQIYRVEPRFLADPIVETIPYNDRFIFIPRGSTEECYYLKAFYYDKNGYPHLSGKSATVCVPAFEEREAKEIVLTPEKVFSMLIDRYDLTGRKKDPYLGTVNCGKGDTAHAVAAPRNYNVVNIIQEPCYGKRTQMFATFDLSPIRYKRVERATLSFNKVLRTHENNSPIYNSTCLSSVRHYPNVIAWSGNWNSPYSTGFTIREEGQTHFEFDFTRTIRRLAELGQGTTDDYPLLFGLVPDNFKPRHERGIGYFSCFSFFENIKIDITYFEY